MGDRTGSPVGDYVFCFCFVFVVGVVVVVVLYVVIFFGVWVCVCVCDGGARRGEKGGKESVASVCFWRSVKWCEAVVYFVWCGVLILWGVR